MVREQTRRLIPHLKKSICIGDYYLLTFLGLLKYSARPVEGDATRLPITQQTNRPET